MYNASETMQFSFALYAWSTFYPNADGEFDTRVSVQVLETIVSIYFFAIFAAHQYSNIQFFEDFSFRLLSLDLLAIAPIVLYMICTLSDILGISNCRDMFESNNFNMYICCRESCLHADWRTGEFSFAMVYLLAFFRVLRIFKITHLTDHLRYSSWSTYVMAH